MDGSIGASSVSSVVAFLSFGTIELFFHVTGNNIYISESYQFLLCFLFQGQRTVYRLTLVKSWNNEEIKNYADLVSLGKPDFIEVKVLLRFFVSLRNIIVR